MRHGISPNQIYVLDCLRNRLKPTSIVDEFIEISKCKDLGLIDQEGVITPGGLSILDEFETYLVKTKKKVETSVLGDNFLDNIKSYIDLFPQRKLPSGRYARQPVKDVKDAFIWFFKNYPENKWTDVLDATHYYIYMAEQKDYLYMMDSLYFISKTDNITKKIRSALASSCLEIKDNPDLNQNNNE
jgi:hypothetical protein